jgi:hypothetical protein
VTPPGCRQFGNICQIAYADIMRRAQTGNLARQSPGATALELFELVAALRRDNEQRLGTDIARLRDELVIAIGKIVEPEHSAAIVMLDPGAPFATCHSTFVSGAARTGMVPYVSGVTSGATSAPRIRLMEASESRAAPALETSRPNASMIARSVSCAVTFSF